MTDDETATTDDPIQVVLVSGFLGAGKTTALRAAGERLTEQGYTVGMVTNDQASGLVDTAILDESAGTVVEIPGGCFCCNFEDLIRAAHRIDTHGVDVLLAEPVGSCTDLVATVATPLRRMHDESFAVTPLTAVLDPDRARAYLDDGTAALPEEVRYIFRKQVEEADLVALNKTDTLTERETDRLTAELSERVGDRPVVRLSAATGSGIEEWLSLVVDGFESDATPAVDGPVSADGRALTDIDYDTYAAGEAKLGWVNTTVALDGPLPASEFRAALMDRIQAALGDAGIEVAHLKFSLATDEGLAHANLTATDAEPGYGGADPGTVDEARLVFNARAVGDPETIQRLSTEAIERAASAADATATVEAAQAFRPEYPEPVHRMEEDVDPGTTASSTPE